MYMVKSMVSSDQSNLFRHSIRVHVKVGLNSGPPIDFTKNIDKSQFGYDQRINDLQDPRLSQKTWK